MSPRYIPETNFSKCCFPGLGLAASTSRSAASQGKAGEDRAPHSMLMTIESAGAAPGGGAYLAIRRTFSTYAAFVPVPRITPSTASSSAYFAAASVPTVSFTRAATVASTPRRARAAVRSATTS